MSRQVGWLHNTVKTVLSPLAKFGWRVHASGLENVPEAGAAIICPNHVSVLDSFFVPIVLPRRITYVGKAEYMDSWKTKHLFPACGMIPIDRSGGEASSKALEAAAGVLERGELFGIYPEGTRSRDGLLHKGHTGAVRLALRTGAPIVPVGIRGTVEIMPPEAKLPNLWRPVYIGFGRPIDPAQARRRGGDDHLLLRRLTDELMFNIRELSAQEYVNTYATKKAEDIETPTAVIPPALEGNGQVAVPEEKIQRSSAEVLNRV